MNLRLIGGNCNSIVGLAEPSPINMATGEGRNIKLFLGRREMNTVLGRSFLEDANIKLEFSQQKGKVFSYKEPDGRRICLLIFLPKKVGWREDPPKLMEVCGAAKIEDWDELEEKEDGPLFITTETESPWEGYTNWKPLSNSDCHLPKKYQIQDHKFLL
ncbi:hypothetical protein O181_000136 [Austropuccinia psidii MF-1]|uniref:Uncharacterized protein n=1 Tax=Austropuccinia psidii MF-1 TaxID=1389203 RepID=A0A9Q3GBB4_9BASI|nr:hypothetical protein [Austropuccinia psidii MF-1]